MEFIKELKEKMGQMTEEQQEEFINSVYNYLQGQGLAFAAQEKDDSQ